jgi:2-polyprenyl-6-methoxyphenol hydroxylase-like FAD-dependent oxidoreductase
MSTTGRLTHPERRGAGMRVVIAGAGIGGLTAALCLHAKGIPAQLLESAREIAPLGVGINLQPDAVGILADLGFGEALADTGLTPRTHRYITSAGAEVWSERRGQHAGTRWPQYSIHRGVLEMLLHDAVTARLGHTAISTGRRVLNVNRPAGVTVLDRTTGKTGHIEGDIVIGADGAHSAIQAALHPKRRSMHYSGVQMWRGMTELNEFGDGETMYIGNGNAGCRLIAYPISRRGRHTLVNWVCLVPTDDEQPVDDDAAVTAETPVDEVLPHYADWTVADTPVAELLAGAGQILRYPMVDRDPLPFWTADRVTLLGDAAHLMYPVGANGGSQAILDAAYLADTIVTAADPGAALHQYESRRRPITAAIVHANREMDTAERQAAPDDVNALGAIADRYRAAVTPLADIGVGLRRPLSSAVCRGGREPVLTR